MKDACAFLAILCCLLATGVGNSQELGMTPRPIIAGSSRAIMDTTQAVPAAKCLSLQQRLDGFGKVRPVSYTESPAGESTTTAQNAAPTPPADHAMAPMAGLCLNGPAPRCCWEQLDDWLTYRPLEQNCCDCFPKCAPCCPPALYTFFIGTCCVAPPLAESHPRSLRNLMCGCRQRLANGLDGMRSCRLWPGNFGIHFWHGPNDFLFWHGKNGTQEETIVENQN